MLLSIYIAKNDSHVLILFTV